MARSRPRRGLGGHVRGHLAACFAPRAPGWPAEDPPRALRPRRLRDGGDGTMTGRSPLKQPGVPSKETAAEHARRIAKTRAAYASMSRRGGALHGALRPGSAASDRGAPRDSRGWHFSFAENARDGDDSEDAPPGGSSAFAFATGRTNGHAKSGAGAMRTREKKRETRLESSVDVLAALAYARGAERAPPRTFAAARDSDDSDDSDDDGVTRASPPTGNLRSRLNRDLSSPDDPLTPSRAWFARSALARSRADSDASDLADEAEEATRRRFRAVAEFEAVARAKRARAAASAAASAANVAAAGAETAVANMRAEMEASISASRSDASDERDETRNANANEERRARAPSLAPSPPPPTPRAPRGVTADSRAYEGGLRSPQDPFHAFANAATRTRTRTRDENEQKNIGGASYSASAALVAARDALAGAAAAAAELTKAAARTPSTARRWEHVTAHSETSGASASPRRRRFRETVEVSLRDGEPPTGDPTGDPTSVDERGTDARAEAEAVNRQTRQISVALDFSAATRRMMDAGRARRAELLAAYQALAARCRAANASSLAETREKKNGAEANGVGVIRDARDETTTETAFRVKTKTKTKPRVETADTPNRPFVVPSRDDTLRLIRDMEDRARRSFAGAVSNPPRTFPADSARPRAELQSAATAPTAFASPRGLRTFARRPPSAVPTHDTSAFDSDDSAGLTPPPREKNDAARFFLSEEEKETARTRAGSSFEGKGPRDPGLGLDVPFGVEPELRVSDVRDFESLVTYAFQ